VAWLKWRAWSINCLADARLSVNEPSVVPRWVNQNSQLKAAATQSNGRTIGLHVVCSRSARAVIGSDTVCRAKLGTAECRRELLPLPAHQLL